MLRSASSGHAPPKHASPAPYLYPLYQWRSATLKSRRLNLAVRPSAIAVASRASPVVSPRHARRAIRLPSEAWTFSSAGKHRCGSFSASREGRRRWLHREPRGWRPRVGVFYPSDYP
ncbi:hypothetical protein SKAU_G00316670 [Synaphobranchus kaupii]|uniref:Uncharacterized protein n=1 Tax=Synaphobranchus kaupii TaxID=118154 RepID=A0A9Q1ILL3_SYNKA|nr:hypothetical protein SKAU_G00316670 [Synaphobranchus kaupii]